MVSESRSSLSYRVPPRAANLPSLLAAAQAEAAHLESKLPDHVEGEVLVKLDAHSRAGIADFADTYGAQVKEAISLPHRSGQEILHLKLAPGMTTAQALTIMRHDPRVDYAATNDIIQLPYEAPREDSSASLTRDSQQPGGAPSDLSPKLWGMKNNSNPGVDIHAADAWKINTGSRTGPVLAVIDTGIDYNHRALRNNVWTGPDGTHGFNAITGTKDPNDDHYHGTHCAGTIAGNGQDGVYGVNHKAQVMGVKFLNKSGSGQLADAIKGIVFAEQNGARIMSNSWGGGPYNEALRDAVASTSALQVFAAGNDGSDNDVRPTYPASYHTPNMITVAASDNRDKLANFSNYGKRGVDLAAPGVDIWSTVPGDKYKLLDGTSMATPHVAGAALLIATEFPGISNEEIKARILYNVDRVPGFEAKIATSGRLNLAAALKRDSVAPGSPSELSASDAKPGQVTLNWIAAGDDGHQGGKAAAYELRVSDRPIVDGPSRDGAVSFEDARPVEIKLPGEVGSSEVHTVDLPLSAEGRSYYFALRAIDHIGQASAITTVKADVPAAKVAFVDDKDAGHWSAEGGWAQVDEPGRGKVWTDSPNGDYANNSNASLTSKSIDLSGITGSKLMFDERHSTEAKYDKVFVEVSNDGKTWNSVKTYTGASEWNTQTVDLSAYDGQSVQVRFRLNSDASSSADGFYLDNLLVAGA